MLVCLGWLVRVLLLQRHLGLSGEELLLGTACLVLVGRKNLSVPESDAQEREMKGR